MFNWFKKKKYSQEELDAIAKKSAIEAAKAEARRIFEMIGQNKLHESIDNKNDYDALKEALTAFSKTVVGAGLTDSDFTRHNEADSVAQVGAFKTNMSKFFNSYRRMSPQEAGMLSRHWLIGKAIAMPIKTALRRGFKIDGEYKKELDQEVKRSKLYARLAELGIYARSMGGALMFFKTYDPNHFSEYSEDEYYKAPFRIDAIQKDSEFSITVFDSYLAVANSSGDEFNDPLSEYYYEPEFYTIGGKTIHRSHFVKYVPYDVPKFMKPYYWYYGISVPERVMEKVYAAESSSLEGLALLKTKRLLTLQIPDLVDRNDAQVESAMNMIANAMNNFSFLLLDGSTNVGQHDVSLTDLESTVMMNYQLVASASEAPADQLLGTSPKGFNTTGEYQQDVWHGVCEGVQDDLSPAVERFFAIQKRRLGLEKDIEFQFNPLTSLTDREIAEINEINARTSQILVTLTAISPEEAREYYNSDENSIFKDRLNGEAPDMEYELDEGEEPIIY